MKKIIIILICVFSQPFLAQEKNETAIEYQTRLNKEYADSISSPLLEKDRKEFKVLDFYAINEKFIVKATFEKIKRGKVFKMKTTTSRAPKYKVFGLLKFQIDGKDFQLYLYQNIELSKKPQYKDYLFLPFLDLTNGDTTYGGGRYLDMRIPNSKEVVIDFNKAYNPYCAYNHKYSCPLVPEENFLNFAIEAGVKKFH